MSSKNNAPRGPGCQWLYLRVTVGLLNALFVLGVALVALLVTATASLKALNDNGEAHVAALGNAAAFRVSTFFDQPHQQAIALTTQAFTEELMLPSQHPSTKVADADRAALKVPLGGFEVERATTAIAQSMMDFKFNLFATSYWLADGTRSIVFPIPQVKNAVYLEKWWRDNVTDVLSHRETIMYDVITGLRINSSDPRHGVFMPTRENVTLTDASSTATFNTLAGLVHLGRDKPVRWSAPRFFHESVPYRYILASRAVYNSTDLLGFAISGVTLGRIGKELDEVRSSPESLVLVVGTDGFVLGASGGVETFNVTEYAGEPLQPGCTSTDLTASTVPSDRRLLSCMHHVDNFQVPAVHALAQSGEVDRVNLAKPQQLKVTAEGTTYFARIQMADVSGLPSVVIVIVPEKEILGNVKQTIATAAGITAACVVVAAAACFGLVWWLLWPLRGIAVRMGKAARLEEDPDPVAISPLAEIGDLQRAFVEMRDELDRIRSYVPQSLLRAADSTDAEEDDVSIILRVPGQHRTSSYDPNASSTEITPRSRASEDSRRKSEKYLAAKSGDGMMLQSMESSLTDASTLRSHQHKDSVSPTTSGHKGVKIVEGLRRETVSVLCLNVCGFHRFFDAGGTAQRGAVSGLVDAVLIATRAEKGVVESFHGDRFLVSFNAVKPAANHGIRATVAAMQVAEAAESLGLAVTAGVATGTAQVGNMGTKGMMRFTIVGPVVAQAATLERLCKVYTAVPQPVLSDSDELPAPQGQPVRCLVPQRLFQDLSTAAVTRTVDYVHLPQAKNPCLIAEVDHLLRAGADDEWMYQLQAHAPADVSSCPIAAANGAWEACVAKDYGRAQLMATALDANVEKNPTADSRRAADCPRLKANCVQLTPRDLGDFYNKSLRMAALEGH